MGQSLHEQRRRCLAVSLRKRHDFFPHFGLFWNSPTLPILFCNSDLAKPQTSLRRLDKSRKGTQPKMRILTFPKRILRLRLPMTSKQVPGGCTAHRARNARLCRIQKMPFQLQPSTIHSGRETPNLPVTPKQGPRRIGQQLRCLHEIPTKCIPAHGTRKTSPTAMLRDISLFQLSSLVAFKKNAEARVGLSPVRVLRHDKGHKEFDDESDQQRWHARHSPPPCWLLVFIPCLLLTFSCSVRRRHLKGQNANRHNPKS